MSVILVKEIGWALRCDVCEATSAGHLNEAALWRAVWDEGWTEADVQRPAGPHHRCPMCRQVPR